jgi:limonene-1,2-epoxide hydrolase
LKQFAAVVLLAGMTFPQPALATPAPSPSAQRAQEKHMKADPKIVVVQNMIDAWNTRNWQRVGDLFTEDGILHSMMIEPVVGRKTISDRISAMGAGISSITLHIRNIGRVGDVVIIERVDEFVYNGHAGKVPVVGVLVVEGDKIKEWREYYDRAELIAAMGLPPESPKPTAAH